MTAVTTQNQHSSGWWPSHGVSYLTPPISASAAIVPFFYGFIAKSAQQMAQPLPKMTYREIFKEGLKVAPTVGFTVGAQMIAQHLTEKALSRKSKKSDQPNFRTMLASSTLVGTISAPALASFNGQIMRRSTLQSLKTLSPKQVGAIASRETSFLFSLRMSDPLCDTVKRWYANTAMEYSSVFISGAIGSLVGHPADTALTLWQQGRKIKTPRQLMQGAPIKALAVGGFSVVYKLTKDAIESLSS
ncbi:MAG: hypothetical protein ACSNEK_04845 [Parachlamydiaceae bacterium]